MAWYRHRKEHGLAAKGIKTRKGKKGTYIPTNVTKKQWLKGDFDKDKVPNYKDCRPLNPKKHFTGLSKIEERKKGNVVRYNMRPRYETPGNVYFDTESGTFIQKRGESDKNVFFGRRSEAYNLAKRPIELSGHRIGWEWTDTKPHNLEEMPKQEFHSKLRKGTLFNVDKGGEAKQIHRVPNVGFSEQGYYVQKEKSSSFPRWREVQTREWLQQEVEPQRKEQEKRREKLTHISNQLSMKEIPFVPEEEMKNLKREDTLQRKAKRRWKKKGVQRW